MFDAPEPKPRLVREKPRCPAAMWPGLGASLCIIALAAAVPRAQSGDSHPKLPPGEGRDVMIRVCSQCHDPEWAADFGNDEAAWKATVEQMRKQGAQGTDDEFAQIVKYLTAAFPPK